MKKPLIAILMTAVFLISICGPLISIMNVAATVQKDPDTWYMQENGQLASDYYSLYPYDKSSLNIGFSKYGEFIDNATNVGLEYAGARDPWAPLVGMDLDIHKLPKNVWINGWYIDINYVHSNWGSRNLWAGAMFADLSTYGGPWLHVDSTLGGYNESQESFSKPGYAISADNPTNWTGTLVNGGRKTNGTVVTDPISVLYDGPREFVAILMNHIYDVQQETNDTINIVNVMFTVIFNKVSKEIIVLKDIKIAEQAKLVLSSLTVRVPVGTEIQQFDVTSGILVQFSNREEWDLGTNETTSPDTPIYSSYAHFYTNGTGPMWGSPENDTLAEGQLTEYNALWTALPTIPANTSIVGGWQNTSAYGPAPTESHADDTYDVAQMISNDGKYVGFAAYWPSLSDWSIDAGRRGINPSSVSAYGLASGRKLWTAPILGNESHDIDSYANPNDEPFTSPVTVGEWDFMLSDKARIVGPIYANIQFRGVAVYGVTDEHDGSDANFLPTSGSNPNVIDREVRYQLDMVFNPYDLSQAESKDTMRWVQKEWGDGYKTDFRLEYTYEYPARPYVDIDSWPYVDASDFIGSQSTWNTTSDTYYNVTWTPWDSYNYYSAYMLHKYGLYDPTDNITTGSSFPERVLVDGVLQERDVDYILWTNASEAGSDSHKHYSYDGLVWINFTTAPDEDAEIKILFSTGGDTYSYYDGSWEWGTVGSTSAAVDSVGLGMATEWAMFNGAPVKNTGFDTKDTTWGPYTPYTLAQQRPALLPGRNGYRDANPANNTGRLALKDDWCMHYNTTDGSWINGVPVASSNIIAVGGPYANGITEYFNDFTSAFVTMSSWTINPHDAGQIMPLTCWSLNHTDTNAFKVFHGYASVYNASNPSQELVGYGVISTAKDLNGTVGLTAWGYSGDDTYYTSWALLHSDVLALAFQVMPPGVTSLILRFNYTLHPTDYCFVTIIEALGTISEYDAQSYFGVGPFVTQWKVSDDRYGPLYGWPTYPAWVNDPKVGKYPKIHIDP
jgi:hypothetical protein